MGGDRIARKLCEMNIPGPTGGLWSGNRILDIVQNEKYIGDSLLQKKYVSDHLTKKLKRNRGELARYYARGTHPAIIEEEMFQKAQEILRERRRVFKSHDVSGNRYSFSGMIVCGNCGKHYQRKLNGEYKKPVWICATFNTHGKSACASRQIPENILIEVCADALGMAEFDAVAFGKRVERILVPEANRLVFVLKNGKRIEKTWRNPSRSDSWSDEMRRMASARQCAVARGLV